MRKFGIISPDECHLLSFLWCNGRCWLQWNCVSEQTMSKFILLPSFWDPCTTRALLWEAVHDHYDDVSPVFHSEMNQQRSRCRNHCCPDR
jgi:hypothetical protein